jgi:galactokinase
MKSVAKALGQEVLSRCSYEELASKIAALRPELGDRAILRAIHFFNETKRAKDEFEALEKDDVQEFLRLVNASGMSSWTLLQNVAVPGSAEEQPMPLALAVSQQMLGKDEACRVHGGGFAGTILTFVKNENKESYVKGMEAILGEGACHELMIRPVGGLKVIG